MLCTGSVERLNDLRDEYEQNTRYLCFPFNVEDHAQLKERNKAIRAEAKALAKSLNIPNLTWFSEG